MARIPNKKAALRQVALHMTSNLQTSADYDEAAGVDEDSLTAAETRRLDRAVDEVLRRLHAMGGAEPVKEQS
jgi:hypothetical protein